MVSHFLLVVHSGGPGKQKNSAKPLVGQGGNFLLRRTSGVRFTESAEENLPLQPLHRAKLLSTCNGPPPHGRERQSFVHPGAAF
jgi:hypothetical protein